ncbi:citrate:proton symporter [Citricoccus nitrophenolicus]|uniref:Citrate:proton symporter n=1 Tax=Citricoccus nitrophenolicus TaxID=863575 RepID=A0ABV0IJ57_9MICC
MLTILGFATIVVFLVLTMTNRVSVLIGLIAVPVVAALIGGFGPQLGELSTEGILQVTPVAVMITFAILYFSLMMDEGLFDPAIRRILRWVKGDPARITVGTAVLTMLVALDGDGATTFLITVSAMLPLYQRLGMRPLVLAGVVGLAAGVMNILPWGGPTARAMAVLDVGIDEIFIPVIPSLIAGIVWILAVAWYLGLRERRRIGVASLSAEELEHVVAGVRGSGGGAGAGSGTGSGGGSAAAADLGHDGGPAGRRATPRWRMVANLVLTLVLLAALVAHVLPLHVLFILSFVIALIYNRPRWADQQRLLEDHGKAVLLVISMIFAAGIFTGVLGGTGMITAMADSLVSVIPTGLANLLPLLTALTSMPMSLMFTPDAYYFGVLPVLAETYAASGGDPSAIGRAAIMGQMTTGFPLSPLTAATFILIGLTSVQLGEHQKFLFGWAFGTTIVMTAVAILTGAIPL